jgi:hypothetical protein
MINYSEYAQDIVLNTAAQIGAIYRQNGWSASDVSKVAKAVKDEQAKAIFLKAYNSPSKEHVEVSKTQTAFGIWLFSVGHTKGKEPRPYCKLVGLYLPGVIEELQYLGFYKRYDERNNLLMVRETESILDTVETAQTKDAFYNDCVKGYTDPVEVHHAGKMFAFEPTELHNQYLEKYQKVFNDGFLEHLATHTKPILRDTKNQSYFFFQNCIVRVDNKGHEVLKKADLKDCCIWRDQILPRDYSYTKEQTSAHFYRFVQNVTGADLTRFNAMRSGLGYLLHNYNKPTAGQVVIFYDEKPARKGQPEGGSGKGLAVNAIKQMRNTVKIDGKKYDTQSNFKWQTVTPTTQVVWLDDVKANFPFEDLHSNSTDGWNIERKHQTEFYLPPHESPKVVICSNTIMTNDGSTNKRRQFIIEFSDYYSQRIVKGNEEPIRTEHGCTFFDADDWQPHEWNMFYSFMIDCATYYHKKGLQVYEFKNLLTNQLLQRTNEDFTEWILGGAVEVGKEYDLKELFLDFNNEDEKFPQRKFTEWLRYYAGLKNLEFEKRKSAGKQYVKLIKK